MNTNPTVYHALAPARLGIRCNGCGATEEVEIPQPIEDMDTEGRYLAVRLDREGWEIDPQNPGQPARCPVCVATGTKAAPVAALAMRMHAPASGYIGARVPADTVSPLWTDRIAAELARHHLDRTAANPIGGLACTCGATVDPHKDTWQADGLDRHRAEAVVAALQQ